MYVPSQIKITKNELNLYDVENFIIFYLWK